MYDFAVDPSEYPFKEGALFIGEDQTKKRLGIVTKRHAITIAGARTGKGVGVVNTNLRTWKENAFVIDPKAEATEVSWQARAAMGQDVRLLDPFEEASGVPDTVQASYNPLDDLDLNGSTISEDIDTIADGVVMRSGHAGDTNWDDGGADLIAGLIAFVIAKLPQDEQNLISVRNILTDQAEGGLLDTVLDEMGEAQGSGLASKMRAGAARARAKEGKYYISNAEKHTKFLDSEGMAKVLSSSSFSMRDLKRGNVTVFIALPFRYLARNQHGRFLRLMVRCGINAMQEKMPNGEKIGNRCLFLLDEFFSLGYIDEIATAIGGLPGYGLHLWPILQDLGQLTSTYGQDKAGTFFGSSDLHQFFGNTDTPTLEFISNKVGAYTAGEMPTPPTYDPDGHVQSVLDDIEANKNSFFGGSPHARKGMAEAGKVIAREQETIYRDSMASWREHTGRLIGRPRLTPDQIAHLTRLEENAPTAEAQIAFVRGGRPLICYLSRYFEWAEVSYTPKQTKEADSALDPASDERQEQWVLAPSFEYYEDEVEWATPSSHREELASGRYSDDVLAQARHLGCTARWLVAHRTYEADKASGLVQTHKLKPKESAMSDGFEYEDGEVEWATGSSHEEEAESGIYSKDVLESARHLGCTARWLVAYRAHEASKASA